MTPEQLRRSEAITAALDALGWFRIPHTVDSVIGVYAEATRESTRRLPYGASPTELADVLRSTEGAAGYGKGGHSDPTAHAALMGEPDAVDPDETLPQIDHALGMILTGATEADHLCTDALGRDRWNPKPSELGRQGQVTDAVSRIEHLRPNLETALLAPDVDVAHIDGLVRIDVAETAAWLHTKCVNIWTASRGDHRPAEQSRKLRECACCSTWRKGTIATRGEHCDQCANFKSNHGCYPIEGIVRRWEYGKGATPALILEAQATAKKAKRAERAS